MAWAIRITSPFEHARVDATQPITFHFEYIGDGAPSTPVPMIFRYHEAISSGVFGPDVDIVFSSADTSLTLPANTWQPDKIYKVLVRPQEEGLAGGSERAFSTEYFYVDVDTTGSSYLIDNLPAGTYKAVVKTTALPGLYSYDSNEVTFVRTQGIWTLGEQVTSSVQQGQIAGLPVGDYEVQVRTADAEGFGPWSEAVEFLVTNPPTATGLSIADAAQGTLAAASWTYSDPDGDPQVRYQLRHRPAGSTPAYPGAVMALDPLRYYRFAEGGGTTAFDETGTADGTYMGAGTAGGSPVPSAAGRDGGYTTVPNWTKPQALTINCWFKCDPGELDDNTSYRSLWGFNGNDWDARFTTRRAVRCHTYNADGSQTFANFTTDFDMDDGVWHMLTMVWDGVVGETRSYVDGVLAGSSSFAPSMPRTHTGAFSFGAAGTGRVWAGEYAEAALFGHALTDTQVADLYAAVGDVSTPAWTTLPEVTSATPTGTIDTTGLDLGDHEAAVRVFDGTAWSEWSEPVVFIITLPSNVHVKSGGTWKLATNHIKVNGQWVQAKPTKTKSGGSF